MMKVYAIHDRPRAAILVYVELFELPDGSRHCLTRPLDNAIDELTQAVEVHPGCEAPVFVTIPGHIAPRVVEALTALPADPFAPPVELEGLADFAAVVDRLTEQTAAH